MRRVLASAKTPIIIGALICAAYATLLLPRPWVDWFTFEDGVWESLGAVGVFAACVVMVLLWRRSRGHETKLYQLALLGLAVVFFFAGGEEIAWGQHFFHWPTPNQFAARNYQHETTVHNLKAIRGGPGLLFNLFWFTLGVVIPLVAAINDRARGFLRRYLPVFPLWLAALFLLNHAVSKGVRVAIPGSLYHGSHFLGRTAVEIKEAGVESLFFVGAAWLFWGEPAQPLVQRALRTLHVGERRRSVSARPRPRERAPRA